MADIFLSYNHTNRDVAQQLADRFCEAGFSVWWDDQLSPRLAWDETIEREIGAALSVVVLWSPRAVGSEWVRSEATYAHNHKKLVPVIIEPCQVPLAFSLVQAVDLSGCSDDPAAPNWRKLLVWLADIKLATQTQDDLPAEARENKFRRIERRLDNGEPVYAGDFITCETPAGTLFVDHEDGPVMRIVGAGSFMIGSDGSDPDHLSQERPRKSVTIARAFALGIYPVGAGTYLGFCGEACVVPVAPEPRRFLGLFGSGPPARAALATSAPASALCHVNFNDATRFTHALTSRFGATYRLPSEAEWEYGCRGGTTTRYSFGHEIDARHAWFCASRDNRPTSATQAGRFPPNRFGLFDMHGNVREWTMDSWHDNHDLTPSDGLPYEDTRSSMRVVRGGSWSDLAVMLRSAARGRATESLASAEIGLRLLRELPGGRV